MLSKWEWIAEKAREIGNDELAVVAEDIEKLLKEIYGDTITKQWEEDYHEIEWMWRRCIDEKDEIMLLRDVMLRGYYCIACVECNRICFNCSFARLAGRCSDDDSLFGRAYDKLKEVEW